MAFEWWHWAVFGIALILSELAMPAFVLIWFGLGALVLALLVAVLPDMSLTAQLAIWTVLSVTMVFVWMRVFKPSMHKTKIGMSDANVLGEVGLLTHDVAPFAKGQVRFQKPILGGETWDCIADESIHSGERVRVVGIEGSLLKIKRA